MCVCVCVCVRECVCVTLTRQWSPASLSSDLKEESWSGDREMEGFLWTGMKTTVGHREGFSSQIEAVSLSSRKLMSGSDE